MYEVLTKQWELAKVQEAKEIPSIRVLDEPVVPERKVWPPRIIIIILGTLMTLFVAVLYLLGRARLQQFDPEDPRQIIVYRLFGGLVPRG